MRGRLGTVAAVARQPAQARFDNTSRSRRSLPAHSTAPSATYAALKAENEQLTTAPPNFDAIARPYRWLEYLTFGRALERCRLHFLDELADRGHALVLGDGDGRFLAALMAQNAELRADAVDTSAVMLRLLRERCRRATPDAEHRLHTRHTDALSYLAASTSGAYDLVVTHFFLDCLTQSQMEALATAVTAKMAANALWVVSDFRIPEGPMGLPARALVSGLYLGFRILTGLRITSLPNHAVALNGAGFLRIAQQHFLFGMLTTELWSRVNGPTAA